MTPYSLTDTEEDNMCLECHRILENAHFLIWLAVPWKPLLVGFVSFDLTQHFLTMNKLPPVFLSKIISDNCLTAQLPKFITVGTSKSLVNIQNEKLGDGMST